MCPVSLDIIRFCAREAELQMSGEISVANMVHAWMYAQKHADRKPTIADVLELGRRCEPVKNHAGFRKVPVFVGWEEMPKASLIPGIMVNLLESIDYLSPSEFCLEYLRAHPWRDSNGRTSVILYCWLSGTLQDPDWPPNYFNDSRRTPGSGAPKGRTPGNGAP